MNDTTDARPLMIVVEDEAVIALHTTDTLEQAGYRVALHAAPSNGIGSEGRPVAAVVNLGLDRLDGRDLIRRLRVAHPGLPVVVVTGYGPLSPAADLRGLGGPTARLEKPVDADRLVRRLAEAIASRTGVA